MFCMILRERSIATATTTIKGKQRLQVKGTHTELLRPLKMIKNKWGVRGKKKKRLENSSSGQFWKIVYGLGGALS